MYQLGYAFTEGMAKKKKEAALSDQPTSTGDNTFETTALGLEGTHKDKYFGSVKWGYKLKPGDVELEDIELASMGVPTQNYLAPVELWNTSRQQGTLEVTADPAIAKNIVSPYSDVNLAKGTKARQLATVDFGPVPYVKVEKLAGDGTGTGQQYYVRVVDLKDIQDGKSTVAAPWVKVAINPAQTALYRNPERTLKVKDLPPRTRMRDTGACALDLQRDHERIQRLAHELYEKRGKQDGLQDADWFQAEAILKGSHGVEIADGPDTGVTGYVDPAMVTPE